jgi:hypothetical protein
MSATNESFIDYWNAVDAAMQDHFGTDTGRAAIGAALIADSQDAGWSPEDFAFWCGENYRLTMRGAT